MKEKIITMLFVILEITCCIFLLKLFHRFSFSNTSFILSMAILIRFLIKELEKRYSNSEYVVLSVAISFFLAVMFDVKLGVVLFVIFFIYLVMEDENLKKYRKNIIIYNITVSLTIILYISSMLVSNINQEMFVEKTNYNEEK